MTHLASRTQDRFIGKRLFLFLVLTYVCSWSLDFAFPYFSDLTMLIPGLLAILFLAQQKELAITFKRGKLKYLFLGAAVSIAAFIWVLVLGQAFSLFQIELTLLVDGDLGMLIVRLSILIPIILIIACILAFGEELAWRGFLLKKLMAYRQLSFIIRALIMGVLWGTWHLPIYFSHGLSTPDISIGIINLCLMSVIYAWLYERECAIWPTVIAHTLHNVLFNLLLPFILINPANVRVLYLENGILMTTAYTMIIAIGVIIQKRSKIKALQVSRG